MRGSKAKRLRKQAGFHPADERAYERIIDYSKSMEVDESMPDDVMRRFGNYVEVDGTVNQEGKKTVAPQLYTVCHGARYEYQQMKRAIRRYQNRKVA